MSPDSHYWSYFSNSNNSMTFYPVTDIEDFSLQKYTIVCNNIMTNGNDFSVSMEWLDDGYTIQSSFSNITFSHSSINSITQLGTVSLLSKNFNTVGYLA